MELLRGVYDIERLSSKLVFGTVNARDLLSLKVSLSKLPHIKDLIQELDSEYNTQIYERLDLLEDVYNLIEISINEEPPLAIKEGDNQGRL